MKMTMTKEFRMAVAKMEDALHRTLYGTEFDVVMADLNSYFGGTEFTPDHITNVILDHAFADFHEELDVEEIRIMIAGAI